MDGCIYTGGGFSTTVSNDERCGEYIIQGADPGILKGGGAGS